MLERHIDDEGHVTTDMPSGDVTTVASSLDAPIKSGIADLANAAGEAIPMDRTEVAPPHSTFKEFPENNYDRTAPVE